MWYLKGSFLLYDKHNDSCGPLRSTTEQVEMEAAKFAMTWDRWSPICRGGAIGNIVAKPSVAANHPESQYTKFPGLLDVKRGTAISLPSRNCVLFDSNPPI